jgi:hypothetical protein
MAPKPDATANTLHLEYELDSVDKAATITKALNTGYDGRPWQLESVSAAPAPLFRRQWVRQLKKCKKKWMVFVTLPAQLHP